MLIIHNSFNSKDNESKNTDNKYNDHVSINIDIKENDFHTFLYEKKGFQIAFLNVHHLFPKFDEIKLLLKDNRAPHIFGFWETFLDEKKQASMICKLINYLRPNSHLFFKD